MNTELFPALAVQSVEIFIECSEAEMEVFFDEVIEFLRGRPMGIVYRVSRILEGPFQVAIQNNDMKIRLWEARTHCEYGSKLEDVYGYALDIGGESLMAEIVYQSVALMVANNLYLHIFQMKAPVNV